MINKDKPLVSVCMITYNQEHYIRQAIEGVLIQKCSFPIELVIGEDFSKDKTREICKKYAKDHQFIRLLPSINNIGVVANFIKTLQACSGKYIALCDGDDYWIDPSKLEKQIHFLETNLDYCLVHTNGYILNRNKLSVWHEWEMLEGDVHRTFFYGPSVRTCSALFRSSLLSDYYKLLPISKNTIIGDWPLFAYYSMHGKFGYLKERMVVYRSNFNSVSSKKSIINLLKYSLDVIEVKRFLRDVIFKGELDELYSESVLSQEINHINLKNAFDNWDFKKAKKYRYDKELNLKSLRLIAFSKNFPLFIVGCIYKWIGARR